MKKSGLFFILDNFTELNLIQLNIESHQARLHVITTLMTSINPLTEHYECT